MNGRGDRESARENHGRGHVVRGRGRGDRGRGRGDHGRARGDHGRGRRCLDVFLLLSSVLEKEEHSLLGCT